MPVTLCPSSDQEPLSFILWFPVGLSCYLESQHSLFLSQGECLVPVGCLIFWEQSLKDRREGGGSPLGLRRVSPMGLEPRVSAPASGPTGTVAQHEGFSERAWINTQRRG